MRLVKVGCFLPQGHGLPGPDIWPYGGWLRAFCSLETRCRAWTWWEVLAVWHRRWLLCRVATQRVLLCTPHGAADTEGARERPCG